MSFVSFRFIVYFYFVLFWFWQVKLGSTLGLWTIQSPVPAQCPSWGPSSGVGLKLNQTLDGHSQEFWATLAPAHFADRTDYRSKVSGWVGVHISLSVT